MFESSEVDQTSGTCRVCSNKALLMACYWCKGKGSNRTLIFFGGSCARCEGSGSRLQCPNIAEHVAAWAQSSYNPMRR
ncbi:MAG TPA: hypothetical protein VFO84_04155 [Dehalococcoidia bacterium]|nr:hypothetical protein [Dehalococcoidia bacterium]